MIDIDVVVPVYNGEKYLVECLDSIIKQKYENWRAICIDDGSTDSSYDILKKYAEKDERFNVYHKSNGGVSSARNYALNLLRDNCWVAFVDCDDYIHPFMFSDLNMALQKISDNNKCNYVRTFCMPTSLRNNFERIEDKSYELLTKDEYFDSNKIGGFICSAFINSNIIKANHLRFDENMSILEDQVFSINAALYSPEILIFNQKNYYYYSNVLSLTNEKKDRGSDIIKCINQVVLLAQINPSVSVERFVNERFLPVKYSMYIRNKVYCLIQNIRKGVFSISLNDLELLEEHVNLSKVHLNLKDKCCFFLLKLFSL